MAVVHELACRKDRRNELARYTKASRRDSQQADQGFLAALPFMRLASTYTRENWLLRDVAVVALELLLRHEPAPKSDNLDARFWPVRPGLVITAVKTGDLGAAQKFFTEHRRYLSSRCGDVTW